MSSEETKKEADKKGNEAADLRDMARKEKRKENAEKDMEEKKKEMDKKKERGEE